MKTNTLKDRLRAALAKRGLVIQREIGADVSPRTAATIEFVRPYTMTTVDRIEAVCSSIEYIVRYDIPGAIVEAGTWLGGSSMAAARTLVECGVTDREFYLYDTFEGLPAPGKEDAMIGGSHDFVASWWEKENRKADAAPWLDAPVETVRENMAKTGYPLDRINMVKGMVEDTMPVTAPEQIAFLRLDTDWYASTKVEMELLFPRLAPGGVLIVDDYGFTEGARRAVDEALAVFPHPVFLHRIDSCGRLAIMPGVAEG